MKRYRKNQKTFAYDFFTKFKIVVPTEKDKKEIVDALHYIHNCNIDTGYVTVNQLAHEYLNCDMDGEEQSNIIVDHTLYYKLEK